MSKAVRIGTRESKLAVIQAELVAAAIQKAHPDIKVILVRIKSAGDKALDQPLDKIGGKGVFVKELEEALRRGKVDLCVHSYKDMPTEENPELPVVAVGPRENPRDVLVLPEGALTIDPARPIGCSSQRRQIQLGALYPGQPAAPVRGNVLTRLEKLDRGDFSALVLAAAGLKRLRLWGRVSLEFSLKEILPAACQGVLAVQGRRGEDYGYLSGYNCRDSWDVTVAERAFIRRLGCGCGAPVGVYGEIDGNLLRLLAMTAGEDGGILHGEMTANRADAPELGVRLAEKMMAGRAI